MSIVPIGINLGVAAALNLLSLVFVRQRSIGGFIANVTVEEVGRDELVITDHPVEQSADISDHAFKKPVSVTIRCGYSNSSLQALGNPNYVQDVYHQFLGLQASRQSFDVITGKRAYTNMLMTSITQRTDEKWENALELLVECREIIIVQTQATTLPPAANMKSPQTTSGLTNTGANALVPAPNFNAAAAPQ